MEKDGIEEDGEPGSLVAGYEAHHGEDDLEKHRRTSPYL